MITTSKRKGRTFLGTGRPVGASQRIVRRRRLPAGVREIHQRATVVIDK